MKLSLFKKELFKRANDVSVSLLEIEDYIYNYYKTKHIPYVNYQGICLTRCSLNEPNEEFENVSRCSYNPKKEKIILQRCNYPNQQVFYGCIPSESKETNSSLTALMETALEHVTDINKTMSFFTLSRWHITRPLILYILPFSAKCIEKNKDFQVLYERLKGITDEKFNHSLAAKEDFYKSFEMICDIFTQFRDKKFYYRISSAFYNVLLLVSTEKKIKIDGLLYPSANTQAAGMNVVLKKELVDDKVIYCDQAAMHSMQRNPDNPYEVKFLDVSKSTSPDENGNFKFEMIDSNDDNSSFRTFKFTY